MTFANLKRVLAVVMLASITTGVFAEEAAPVYEVDNYPPQFDGSADAGPAPAPGVSAAGEQQDLQPQLETQPVPPAEAHQDTVPPPAPSAALSVDQRLRRIEQQVNNAQQSNASAKVDALQNQVQSLRGQVEELTHQLQQMQTQQRAMYADVDKRLEKPADTTLALAATANSPPSVAPTEGKPQPAAAKTVSTTSTPAVKTKAAAAKPTTTLATKTDNQPNVAEEQQIYQTAYDLIKTKKYNEAVATLQKMLQKYPTGQFAANAHYWLGELYGLLNKNEQSAQEFNTVINTFPDSPKVADAQLKVGLIYAGQLKWADAKAAFKKIINRYPGTSSARLAAEQLKQIKSAGH